MQVYKFGGASVKNEAAVRNVAEILKHYPRKKVVVVSAMGKTTNALEAVVNAYVAGNEWQLPFKQVEEQHQTIAQQLLPNASATMARINQWCLSVEQFLLQNTSTHYQFIYDQVVSLGEFLSTTIVSDYCNAVGVENQFLNVKEVLATDHAYTEARVDWNATENAIRSKVAAASAEVIVTQGFIGCTTEGFSTTLGREGSDYTAAIFAFCLQAEKMTVWKDVAGIMNADPKLFPNAVFIRELSYREAIEMTYYGASVIHPKTIKPLQNRNIPLAVRSFIDFNHEGSLISAEGAGSLPPVIIVKDNQVLLSFSTRDFSFIAEEHLSKLFAAFADQRLRANLMQNGAISYSVVVDFKKEKIDRIKAMLSDEFAIVSNEALTLLTIRHYNAAITEELTTGRDILLRQISRNTLQVLMR
ncbi:MAG: aspartate kinase [Chitinophagales bacterium]